MIFIKPFFVPKIAQNGCIALKSQAGVLETHLAKASAPSNDVKIFVNISSLVSGEATNIKEKVCIILCLH